MTEEATKTTSPTAALARELWSAQFKQANPGATAEEQKAAWKDQGSGYRTMVKGALKKLEKKHGIALRDA